MMLCDCLNVYCFVFLASLRLKCPEYREWYAARADTEQFAFLFVISFLLIGVKLCSFVLGLGLWTQSWIGYTYLRRNVDAFAPTSNTGYSSVTAVVEKWLSSFQWLEHTITPVFVSASCWKICCVDSSSVILFFVSRFVQIRNPLTTVKLCFCHYSLCHCLVKNIEWV